MYIPAGKSEEKGATTMAECQFIQFIRMGKHKSYDAQFKAKGVLQSLGQDVTPPSVSAYLD